MASKPFSQASANLAAMVDALSDLVQQDRPDYDVTMKIVGLIGREHGVIRTCLDNTATHDDLLHRLPQLTSTRKKQQEVMMSMCGKMEDSQIEQFCLYILDLDNIIRDVVNALDSRTKEDTAKDVYTIPFLASRAGLLLLTELRTDQSCQTPRTVTSLLPNPNLMSLWHQQKTSSTRLAPRWSFWLTGWRKWSLPIKIRHKRTGTTPWPVAMETEC